MLGSLFYVVELALHPRRASRTSRRSPRRRPCCTCGRWRSRSSSTCSGRRSCSACCGWPTADRRRARGRGRRRGRAASVRSRPRCWMVVAVRTGRRSVARLLRHRHPRAGDADGRRARRHRHRARAAAQSRAGRTRSRIASPLVPGRRRRCRGSRRTRRGCTTSSTAGTACSSTRRHRGRDLASRPTAHRGCSGAALSWARSAGSARSPTRCTSGTGPRTSCSPRTAPGLDGLTAARRAARHRRGARLGAPTSGRRADPPGRAPAFAAARADRGRRGAGHRARRRRVRARRSARSRCSVAQVGQVADRSAAADHAGRTRRAGPLKVLVVGDSQAATLAQGVRGRRRASTGSRRSPGSRCGTARSSAARSSASPTFVIDGNQRHQQVRWRGLWQEQWVGRRADVRPRRRRRAWPARGTCSTSCARRLDPRTPATPSGSRCTRPTSVSSSAHWARAAPPSSRADRRATGESQLVGTDPQISQRTDPARLTAIENVWTTVARSTARDCSTSTPCCARAASQTPPCGPTARTSTAPVPTSWRPWWPGPYASGRGLEGVEWGDVIRDQRRGQRLMVLAAATLMHRRGMPERR